MNTDIDNVLSYINTYWNKIILKPRPRMVGSSIIHSVLFKPPAIDYHMLFVPYTAVVPNDTKYRYIFYWDTYFIFQGLINTSREWVIPEMVENFFYLFKKYHIIPNLSHPESLGRSQPPLLTSMIWNAYEVLQKDKRISSRITHLFTSPRQWLKKAITLAQEEYNDVWQSNIIPDHRHYNHHVAEYSLNVYGGRDIGYPQTAEQESGWDMTSRFYNRCNEFLPIDLNIFLWKYEMDFAKAAEILNSPTDKTHWQKVADSRKNRINTLMWNNEKGFFYDFDFTHKTQSEFESLAGFVPLWAGFATAEQAQLCVKKLPLFESEYGLMITSQQSLPYNIDLSQVSPSLKITLDQLFKPKQWDYPNIWPPLEYMTVIGLMHYKFYNDAKRIIQKSLSAHIHTFKKHRGLLEKLDGMTGQMPKAYWYPTQVGFGWTNAIFYQYTKLLESLE